MLYNAKLNIYSFHQGNLSNDEYLHKFNNLINIATLYDGELHDSTIHDFMVKADHGGMAMYAWLTQGQQTAADECAHNLNCTTMFIAQVDKCCYGKLQEELENTFK